MNLYTMNWILLLTLSAIWGGAFTLNKFALEVYTPELIVAGRLIIGAIVLIILVFLIHRKILLYFKHWPYYLYMSFIGIVSPFLLIAYGQKEIDSSLAGILMSTMPISTLILSHFFLDDEKLNIKKTLGFIIAFLGIIVLVIPDIQFINRTLFHDIRSELMVIGGATLYSCAAVFGKKYKITDPLNASMGTILFAAVIMLIYLFSYEPNISINFYEIHFSSLLLLGIFCTAIATIIYFQILQTSGASFISIMNYLIPVWAIVFGVLFYNEKIVWNYLLGLFIIVLGIHISQTKSKAI